MNKRQEEKLIQMAFGEATDADMKDLRRELSDAEIESFVTEFADIRDTLKSLPVPEHQLSTERLRNAILNQGLEPRPTTHSWLKVLWAPTAMVVAVLAITQVWRTAPSQGEPVVMSSPGLENPLSSNPSVLNFDPSPTSSGLSDRTLEDEKPNEIKTPLRSETRKPMNSGRVLRQKLASRRSMIQSAPSAVLPISEAKESLSNLAVSAMSRGSSADKSESLPAVAAPAEPEASPTLIIIEKSADQSTGANRAREVDSSSNVVIGG